MFQPVDPQRTRVTLRMEYDPKGFVENAADTLGVIGHRLGRHVEKDAI